MKNFKVVLCAIAKCENQYLSEWVDYNLKLGFDKIVIYDNNDINGECCKDALSEEQLRYVSIVNYRGKEQESCETQVEAYNNCYKTHSDYDWIMFLDIDEFLTLDKYTNIKVYLNQSWVQRANAIRFHWKCYTDNGLIHNDRRPVQKRFTEVCKDNDVNGYTKTMFRTNLGGLRIVNVHYSSPIGNIYYPNGKQAAYMTQVVDRNIVLDGGYVRHYVTKSVEEYIYIKYMRRKKGISKTRLSKDLYFKYNERTKEKEAAFDTMLREIIEKEKQEMKDKKVATYTPGTPQELAVIQTVVKPYEKKKNEVRKPTPVANTNTASKPVVKSDTIIADNTQCNFEKGISICITAWHAQKYIEDCLDSVYSQTWFNDNNNWEVIIGIDGCVETRKKVKSIIHKYKNLRVLMMDTNMGTYVTSNTIMREARYEWLLRFDSDDVMYENMIETLMREKEDCDFLLCRCKDIPKARGSNIAEGQVFVKKSIFVKYGGFLNRRCGCDTEFKIRTEKHIVQKQIDDVLFSRIQRNCSLTNVQEYKHGSPYRNEVKSYIKHKSPYIDTIPFEISPYLDITNIGKDYTGKHYDGEKCVISLTSFKARIYTVYKTIESLIEFCSEFHIVLVLSENEFPNKNDELPNNLLSFIINDKIEVLWIKEDYKALKKVIFTAKKYNTVPVISADDDCLYLCNYAEELYNKSLEFPNDIIRYNMYNKDDDWQYTQGPSTLYPPKYYGIIFNPIIDGLHNGTIMNYMDDDTIMTKIIKKNHIHISHIYRGHNFCFKFHDELNAMHNNKTNKDFVSCY